MLHAGYRIKQMLRSKSLLFWTIAFPIFLGMLFYFMFSNINDIEQFHKVPVGVFHVPEQSEFVTVLKSVEVEDGSKMFQVKEYDSEEAAKKALKKETIAGYIDVSNKMELTVKKSNIQSSTLKMFIDQYKQNVALFENVALSHPERMTGLVETMHEELAVKIKEIPLKGQDKDPYAQYFYALIAMTCLICSMIGVANTNDIQADISTLGARRNIAPTSKMKQVIGDFAATYVLSCVLLAIVLFVCVFVYKQDFGSNAGLVFLGACIGSFTGIAIGMMIGVLVKGTQQKKEGLSVAVFMTSSFLGGLQWGDITYVLEKNCPIINRLNPATLIVNAFKSLSVFGDYKQYAVNMGTLLAIGILCLMISICRLRRVKYANI